MADRDFKGIWIPKKIWLNENLTLQEKVFLVEIDSLDNENGCFATNEYFANFFKISKTRVTLVINNLIKKGYIKRRLTYQEGTKQILNRVLNIYCIPYPTKVNEGIQQKLIDSNTVNNTVNNTVKSNESTNKQKFVAPTLQEIQDYISLKNYNVNADKFFYHYESNGWKVGRNKMKSWEMALAKWNAEENPKKEVSKYSGEIKQYGTVL